MASKRLQSRWARFVVMAGAVVCTSPAWSEGELPSRDQATVTAFRERGPEGLAQAIAAYDRHGFDTSIPVAESELAAAINLLNPVDTTPEREVIAAQRRERLEGLRNQQAHLRAAIDQIGGQRSCTVSRLYWYTDLEQAKAEAQRTGRPILSLRMLGKLTDEFSCANSRFFRTSLYSNQEISEYLRASYVLHWQSVRPVPRVTIDFGDGRKLERTLTGNSAHYVLAADGRPLDVLPGLYGPQRFLSWLGFALTAHQAYQQAPEADRATVVRQYHQRMRESVLRSWNRDIGMLGEGRATAVVRRIDDALASARAAGEDVPNVPTNDAAPDAVKAARMAFSKSAMEVPMFRLANLGGRWMEAGMNDELWNAIAALHRDQSKLDAASVALMRAEFPTAMQAGQRAGGKSRVEDPLLRVVRQFEESISLDTVRNEYLLHRRIHEAFAAEEAVTTKVDTLNEWVYAELFLTPSSDPWLGLAPNDVYTALDGNGQVVAASGAPTTSN